MTAFVCPECRSSVKESEGGYRCGSCRRTYPVLFNIPDFRLRGDLYLPLEEERTKAARLHEFGEQHDFRELVRFYYSITDDVPATLVSLFAGYIEHSPAGAKPAIEALRSAGSGDAFVDVGCGSGGALVAAAAVFHDRTGVDIALRWLVIAQKRLEEAGVSASLVCADAEALPYPERTFTHVLASDLFEHTRSPHAAIKCSAAALRDGGHMYVTSSNGRWLGPHPATGVWAAGLLPAGARSALLRRRHGVDILRAVRFVSPRSLRAMAGTAGLRQLAAGPLELDAGRLAHRSEFFKRLARTYAGLANMPLVRSVLLVLGPAFQAMFVKEKTT